MITIYEELLILIENYPAEQLPNLVEHGSPMERATAGVVHPELLPVLVKDTDWWVRRQVAQFAYPALCETLAKDPEPCVRITTVSNAMCPGHVREHVLGTDVDETVVTYAKLTKERLADQDGRGH